jgi:hypothetical protein
MRIRLPLLAVTLFLTAACSSGGSGGESAERAGPRGAAPAAGDAVPTAAGGPEGAQQDLRTLTGVHTRVAWVQHDGRDPFAEGTNLQLMGFDTGDGRGERPIVSQPGSYMKPLLTASGDRVLVSTHPRHGDPVVHVVNFDGTGWQRFQSGTALALWQDPADGGEWVYLGMDHQGGNVGTVSRVRLDDPSRREVVARGVRVSIDTLQLSQDGRTAGGLFPWPNAGVADVATGTVRRIGDGCWTALNDAGALLFWYFDGAHRNLLMADVRSDRRWTVPINRAPGFENPEVYHPRWTRHPRFMAMSGPYDQGGANQVRSGGAQSEIWIGRFNDDYTTIEAWARVTSNARGDAYPDVWMDRTSSPYPLRASGRIGPPAAADDGSTVDPGRLVVEARLVAASSIPDPASIAPYRHALVVNGYEVVRVIEGVAAGDVLAVAQWAIRDSRVLPGAERSIGSVHRLTVERYAAHPELEGERLIQGRGIPDRPLYVEVDSPR